MQRKENNKLLGLESIFEKNGINVKTLAQVLENQEINTIVEIPLDSLIPNKFQPRLKFDNESLKELAQSIKKHGVITPIIVREIDSTHFEIVAGERRTRASKLAQKNTIPAIIADFSDKQMMELALIENIQREDLTGIEEARSYESMKKHLGYTQNQIASVVGKPRSHIANLLRLLTLPPIVQNYILNGQITTGHAKVLVGLNDQQAVDISGQIIRENLSVREVESLVVLTKPYKKKKALPIKERETYHTLEKDFSNFINHKDVSITDKKIQIKIKNLDELKEFIQRFKGEK